MFFVSGFQLMGFGDCGVGSSGVWGWDSERNRGITLGSRQIWIKFCDIILQ